MSSVIWGAFKPSFKSVVKNNTSVTLLKAPLVSANNPSLGLKTKEMKLGNSKADEISQT